MNWSRALRLCCAVWLVIAGLAHADDPPKSPIALGAIRWDGWWKGNPWEKNLADTQWHYRLPFFASTSDGVAVCEDAQDVMDREIAYAKAGGLAYWAFCYYHPKSWNEADNYNYGWKRYLASSRKKVLNFCLLLQGGSHLGPKDDWNTTIASWIDLFKEPTYQRVEKGRPMLYVFSCEHLIPHFGSEDAASKAFATLREASKAAGTGDPYIVAQIWLHQTKADFLRAIRFDALGSYSAQGGNGAHEPYAKLVESNHHYWEAFRDTGLDVVPLVNAGWDGRPRNYKGVSYEPAKPEEVAGAVKSAFEWIDAHPKAAPACTALVYAWNEFDEGGWLCPTMDEGAARLDAVKKMIDGYGR